MIGPGVGAGFMGNFGGLQRDRRIPRAIEAFRPFQADSQAPVGLVAKRKDENGIVSRLRGGGTCGQLLCGRRILGDGKRRQARKKQGNREPNVFRLLRHAEDDPPGE